MSATQAFYVTQGSLTVWEKHRGSVREIAAFADNDEGLNGFNRYLDDHEHQACFIVIDVIEEEFAIEAVPKLGPRDRKALVQRRLQRRFPRTQYRLPVKNAPQRGGEDAVVLSAVTNHELLDPWLQIMLGHELPLRGIYSVPLMAGDMLRRLRKTRAPALLLTQHQRHKLRQVFLDGGVAQSARLSQSPATDTDEYPDFVNDEIGRSRRYLERLRLVGSMQPLDVYIVADSDVSRRIVERAASDSPMQIHCIDSAKAARTLGLAAAPAPDRLETLFIAAAFRRRPRHDYAVSGETRFSSMRRIRHALIGSSIVTAAACAAVAGFYFSDAWLLQRQSAAIEQQLEQLTLTFRRDNERFDPIKADSHEMKLAVDTGDFILHNRLPVPWVMQQVGLVMDDYPDVQILALGWSAESATQPAQPPPRRGEQPLPVPVSAITAVHADITATISPFDGSMRRAFERIDALVADLETETAFTDVAAVEYPIETRPQSAVAGEISATAGDDTAHFRLRLRYPLHAVAAAGTEVDADGV